MATSDIVSLMKGHQFCRKMLLQIYHQVRMIPPQSKTRWNLTKGVLNADQASSTGHYN
jgi:hypothetical protein